MNNASHSTRDFVWVMRIFTFNYVAGALLFFFLPEEIFYLINVGPRVLKIAEEIPMPVEHFWVVLSTSMMMMLGTLSLLASMYPETKGYILTHIVSKVTSVAGFIYLFLKTPRYFAYGLGALTDAMVIVIVLGFYLRALAGRDAALMQSHEPAAAAAHSGEPAGDHGAPPA